MTKTEAPTFQIDTFYAVFYIGNLRTGEGRQVAIVNGIEAARMLATSTDPRRLRFVEVH